MLTRAITGFFFVLIVVSAIYFGDFTTIALAVLVAILGLDEFYKIAKLLNVKTDFTLGFLLGIVNLCLLFFIDLNIIDFKWISLIIPSVLTVITAELYKKSNNPFKNIAFTLLGWIYILFPFYTLFKLGTFSNYKVSDNFNSQMLFGFFIIIWTYDTGAYLSGRFLGKHKLFERISPKKTWEGFIGGIILAIIAAIIISKYFTTFEMFDWIFIAIIATVTATFGDLTESMLKRSAEIKDSGTILPGHGGILDRFDSVLFAAPAVFTYLFLISN
jgi:phosphatidate cytidylyltransferase